MPSDSRCVQQLREGCELAEGALTSLQRLDDPTLWQGPAATAFRLALAEFDPAVRQTLGPARSAADSIEASAAGGGG